MTVVIQNRRKVTQYRVPAGGEILWYGVAVNVSASFVIDSYCSNVFVRGCALGSSSNSPVSDNSHTHTNPSATSSRSNHTHSVGGGTTGGSSGTEVVYQTNNTDSAPPSHDHSIPTVTSGAGGLHSHSVSSSVVADAYPPYARLYWIKALTDAPLPVGGVVMWDAAIAGRPTGFELCSGSGGTPDLRDRFVYGAASDGDVGIAGGAATHVHANSSTGSSGTHTHGFSMSLGPAASNHNISGYEGTRVAAGGHVHGVNDNTDADANHSHTVGNTGSASNLPLYLKLYFVMRTT